MNSETTKPPPFYCPACGKKHRADLSELQAHEGAVAKVPCHRCGIEMSLTIGADGLPKCEPRDPAAVATSPPPPAAALGAPLGGTMPKSSGPLHLLLAVVVAAVVAFLTATLTKGGNEEEKTDGDDARFAALEQRLQDAETRCEELRALTQQAMMTGETATQELRATIETLKQDLAAGRDAISGLQSLQTQMSQAYAKLSASYKALNGRIEGNYQKSRTLEKRLKALEGEPQDGQ